MDGESGGRRRKNASKRNARSKSPGVRVSQHSQTPPSSEAISALRPEELEVAAPSKVTVEKTSLVIDRGPLHVEFSGEKVATTRLPGLGQSGESVVTTTTTTTTSTVSNSSTDGASQAVPSSPTSPSSLTSTINNLMLAPLLESLSFTNKRTAALPAAGNASATPVPGIGSPAADVDGDQRLALLELSLLIGRVLEQFVRTIAKYWVDEQGLGPLGRFLRFDSPIGGIGPTRRILWFLFVGFLLSIIALVLTEDEYYTGPKLDKSLTKEETEKSDFYPVHISFENLGCYVQNVGWVISNISGDARPGRLMGILGASGSGKTTLAHALLGRSRRICTNSIGSIYLNGAPGSLDSFLDRVGFVPQDDVLYPELTVLETLRFSARSRLPRYLSEKYVEDIIQETVATLDLGPVLNSVVGGDKKRGLSGGERKRVSIGLELVTLPSVLVLDEPTSGLDGAQAHKLIGTLKYIASRFNVSVVTVIHQPSARSFSLLDDLLLMQKGRLVFFGERAEAMGYFSSLPSLRDYFKSNDASSSGVEALSPAEVLLDVSTGFTVFNADFMESDYYKRKQKEIREREKQFRLATKNLMVENDEADPDGPRSIMQERCGGYKSELLRALCNIKSGLAFTLGFDDLDDAPSLRYVKRAKRGIIFQSRQWLHLLWTLTTRRGVKIEIFSVTILGATCAYLRHFNRSWQRKQVGSFYISVSLGLVAMIGAALEDDILPVRRAVGSGMLLGAHEFALLVFSIIKGFLVAHLFALVFFSVRYCLDVPPSARAAGHVREFCCTPFSLRTYLRFHHLAQLNYFCARGFALLINVIVDHDEKKSMVTCCAFLIGAHAFSLYSPQMSQLVKDGVSVFGINFSQPMLFLCSFSYVRYFLEAMFLWDPDPTDRVGREFSLRYFSYRDGTEAACATTMSLLIVGGLVVRFVLFAFRNANDYASFHDAPALLIFLFKIISVYGVVLIAAVIFHEVGDLKRAWQASVGKVLRERRTSMSFTE